MSDTVAEQDWYNATTGTVPVIGGETSVTLTSAATLQSLGVDAEPLGAAIVDTSGSDPAVVFPVTGGTDSGDGGVVLLHRGSGLMLSDDAGSIALQDFRVDTANQQVFADVSVDGTSAGTVGVFDIGADGSSLTLTQAAADVVDQALGTTAVTPDVVIGTAAPWFITDPCQLGEPGLSFITAPGTQPITGGQTGVTLTSAGTLTTLGVSVAPLGSASVQADDPDPVASFPITGGTAGPDDSAVILHQGSGLLLADDVGSISLNDFLIDTRNAVVDANVSVNGQSLGNLAVFNIGTDGGTLTLTDAAARAAGQALGTSALTSDVVVGTAAPWPAVLSI